MKFTRIRLLFWTDSALVALTNSMRLNLNVWSRQQRRKLSLFDQGMVLFIYFYVKLAMESPNMGDIPAFVDHKGKPWGTVLCHEWQWFLFAYIVMI